MFEKHKDLFFIYKIGRKNQVIKLISTFVNFYFSTGFLPKLT
jgi:hypothetical protein